jgi:hypothetical protein
MENDSRKPTTEKPKDEEPQTTKPREPVPSPAKRKIGLFDDRPHTEELE